MEYHETFSWSIHSRPISGKIAMEWKTKIKHPSYFLKISNSLNLFYFNLQLLIQLTKRICQWQSVRNQSDKLYDLLDTAESIILIGYTCQSMGQIIVWSSFRSHSGHKLNSASSALLYRQKQTENQENKLSGAHDLGAKSFISAKQQKYLFWKRLSSYYHRNTNYFVSWMAGRT